MGKSYTPKYAVSLWDNGQIAGSFFPAMQMAWSVKDYGKPTSDNLAKYVGKMNASMQPGGVNYGISEAKGFIVACHKAVIHNQFTGETYATWNAPMFQVV